MVDVPSGCAMRKSCAALFAIRLGAFSGPHLSLFFSMVFLLQFPNSLSAILQLMDQLCFRASLLPIVSPVDVQNAED